MGRDGLRFFSFSVFLGAAMSPGVSPASVLDDGEPVSLYAADADARFVGFDVAALPDNDFAVTWVERNSVDQTESVRLARFDRNGEPRGAALTVDDTPDQANFPRLSDPVVATNGAGNKVVVWNSGAAEGASECRRFVQFRLVDNNGTASPTQFFQDTANGFNCNLEVAMNEQGLFILSVKYGLEDNYLMQVRGEDGTGVGAPVTRGQAGGASHPMVVALQESSGMAVWSEQAGPGTVLLASRFDLSGDTLGGGDFRFDNNAHDADGLNQSAVSLVATPDGGYLGAWLQVESDGSEPVYSQRIQRWRADGTVAGSARVGATPFDVSSDRVDLDVGAGGGGAITAWTGSHDDGARDRYATVINGDQAVGDAPVVVARSDAALFDSSETTKVALADETAMVVWYEQTDENSGPILKARIGTLSEAPADSAEGGGGGGGPMGPLVLFATLALLFRKKKPGGNIRPA
ncbi:hypothetical protein [Alloalcanivorax profundimaris]|uniref:hypothetical protein n=1 Tax=Alloalcanivorax profundimaris TaxID=2735259 RepID=UPI001887ED53|nr:hypothetical protein [Alloalcanivorax profundimaris]MBF1802330.1 hypothetical protein [Alloalcanivorax profundimaris]MCQ6260910.1 hypothetical protein [Alcanivorax sp. MM125-6]